MGVFYETIPPSLQKWILDQPVFWIASAPLSASGHINVSPKGGKYFGVIDERTFWYMDLTGSGIETTSHLHEPGNGRITVLFNAFCGPPKIVRLWGTGTVYENGTRNFREFVEKYNVELIPGSRSIVIVDVHQVGTSCGFSVPFFDFKEFRPTLNDHFKKKADAAKAGNEKESIERYWAYKNAVSMDGLPAMHRGAEVARSESIAPMKKMVGPYAPKHPRTAPSAVAMRDVVLIALLCFVLGVFGGMYGSDVLMGRGSNVLSQFLS